VGRDPGSTEMTAHCEGGGYCKGGLLIFIHSFPILCFLRYIGGAFKMKAITIWVHQAYIPQLVAHKGFFGRQAFGKKFVV